MQYQQPQTREQLFEQELQARITPLLQEMPYEGSIFNCSPTISVNQVLEQYSGTNLKGVARTDYKELVDGKITYHNIRFIWELIGGITPQQLNVSPTEYYDILSEARENDNIHEKVIEKDVLDKIKVEINNQFTLIEKKILEQQKPGKAVIPDGKR